MSKHQVISSDCWLYKCWRNVYHPVLVPLMDYFPEADDVMIVDCFDWVRLKEVSDPYDPLSRCSFKTARIVPKILPADAVDILSVSNKFINRPETIAT